MQIYFLAGAVLIFCFMIGLRCQECWMITKIAGIFLAALVIGSSAASLTAAINAMWASGLLGLLGGFLVRPLAPFIVWPAGLAAMFQKWDGLWEGESSEDEFEEEVQ